MKPQKLSFWSFEQLWILNLLVILTFSSVKFFQKSKFKAFKIVKMAVFDLWNYPKVISLKISGRKMSKSKIIIEVWCSSLSNHQIHHIESLLNHHEYLNKYEDIQLSFQLSAFTLPYSEELYPSPWKMYMEPIKTISVRSEVIKV